MRQYSVPILVSILVVALPCGLAGQPPATEVPLDLANTPPGQVKRLDVAPGVLMVRLVNRAPLAEYQFSVAWPDSRPPRLETLPPRPESLGHRLGGLPECDVYQDAVGALVSVTREVDVVAAVDRVRAAAAAGGCPRLAGMAGPTIESATTRLLRGSTLSPEDRAVVEVSRTDGAARWTFEIVARSNAPQWTHPSESAWLAASIAADVLDMTALAQGRPLPPADAVRASTADDFTTTITTSGTAPVTLRLDTNTSPWSPEVYAPLAAALRPPGRPGAPSATSSAETLLDVSPSVLIAEHRRVSAALTTDPKSARAHEQAALLLAAFALRERSGWMSDQRPALSRATAHLAIAHALRGTSAPGVDGQLAAATVSALSGRQKEALERLKAVPRSSRGADGWVRAVEMRVTGDWRAVPDLAAQPPLVALEAFHALIWRKTPAAALDALDPVRSAAVVDWGRVGVTAGSVEAAHRFAPAALSGTMAEIGEVHRAFHGSDLAPGSLGAALDVLPAGAIDRSGSRPKVAVLGWGQWAAFLQRHLLSAVDLVDQQVAGTLGLPADAQLFRDRAEAVVGGLGLRPLLDLRRAQRALASTTARGRPPLDPRGLDASCRQIAELVARRPQSLPFSWWGTATVRCPRESDQGSLPATDRWFRPLVPNGTAYEASARFMSLAGHRFGFDRLHPLHAMAPHDSYLARLSALNRAGGAANPAAVEAVRASFAAILEYDTDAIEYLAALDPKDTALATELRTRACTLAADRCFHLGHLLVYLERPAEAIKAYEKAIAGTRDAVQVANNVERLVDLYWSSGRRDRALTLARAAGATHSRAGLFTLARTFERAGNLREAEQTLRTLGERYGAPGYLDRLYARRHVRFREAEHAQAGTAALTRLFPAGLEKVTVASFQGPPRMGEGIPIRDPGEDLGRLGALPGDTVVAVDGYRVRNNDQWLTIASLSDEPSQSLVVFRKGTYTEVKGRYVKVQYAP